MELTNKVAVITGGATGIGAASAILYARAGAKVVIGDINVEGGKQTVAAIQSEGGVAQFVRTDVNVESEVANLMKAADEAFGQLNVLVTSAGILSGPSIRVDEFEQAVFESVIDTNLRGTFLSVKHAVPIMEASGGVILCIASGAGVSGGSSSVAYGSSKGGVNGMVLTITPQLAPLNIRVHTICPGSIATPLKLRQIAESAERTGNSPEAAIENARTSLGEPEGVARVLTFLASDAASYVRGTIATR